MAEEEKNLDQVLDDTGQETKIDANEYLENLRKLKMNTVSKDLYQKAINDNKKLADALLDGDVVGDTPKEKELTTLDKQKRQQELRNIIFDNSKDKTNLELAKDMVELRDLTIELDGPNNDPFLPKGSLISATQDDYIKAKNVADTFKQCIEVADGNSDIFTRELQRVTVDIPHRK